MVNVRKGVSIAPKTITAISRGTVVIPREQKKRVRKAQMTVTRIDRRVWKKALEIVHGNVSRIRIIDEQTVIVVNNSQKRA